MNSILEQLLVIASPFFAVVATGKKHTAKKSTAKRVAKPKPTTRAKKSTAPKKVAPKKVVKAKPAESKPVPSPKKAARPSAPTKAEPRKGAAPPKPEPKAASVPQPLPPAPKPVRPAGRPILLSPENGKYADNVNPKFRWLSVGSSTRYEVVWSQDPNLINGYSIVSVSTEATVPVEKPLAVGVTYYWHVRGGNEAGWGPWSMPASFSVLEEEGTV
jgi:hypothetical protein